LGCERRLHNVNMTPLATGVVVVTIGDCRVGVRRQHLRARGVVSDVRTDDRAMLLALLGVDQGAGGVAAFRRARLAGAAAIGGRAKGARRNDVHSSIARGMAQLCAWHQLLQSRRGAA